MNLQANAPIIFLLTYGFVPINVVVFSSLAAVKPQLLNLNRVARGSVFNTASAAFLNDFGEGVPSLELAGNTGFGSEYGSGFLTFKLLEAMFIEYLDLRETKLDPSNVHLFYLDTLNIEFFECYPMRFSLNRIARSPQLYFYEISLVILNDLLETALSKIAGQVI